MEMEVFPQGTAGGYEQPAPGAHGAAEPGEHVLHERGAAVPLQPDPPRAVFPLGKVEHSPARVSWFVRTSEIFCLALFSFQRMRVAMGMSKAGTCELPPGSSSQIGHQLLSFSFESPACFLAGSFSMIFFCHFDDNTH